MLDKEKSIPKSIEKSIDDKESENQCKSFVMFGIPKK